MAPLRRFETADQAFPGTDGWQQAFGTPWVIAPGTRQSSLIAAAALNLHSAGWPQSIVAAAPASFEAPAPEMSLETAQRAFDPLRLHVELPSGQRVDG